MSGSCYEVFAMIWLLPVKPVQGHGGGQRYAVQGRFSGCRHLNKVDQLNQTLKGQLHNVTSGLENVIQTARARHRPTPYSSSVSSSGVVTVGPPPLDIQQQQQRLSEQVEDLLPPAQQSRSTAGGTSSQHTTAASCVVQHPGVLCCTKTTASANPTNMTCTVLLETTARQVGLGMHTCC